MLVSDQILLPLSIVALEVPNENGNRDMTNKGRVGALSFDITFFLLGPSTKVWTG